MGFTGVTKCHRDEPMGKAIAIVIGATQMTNDENNNSVQKVASNPILETAANEFQKQTCTNPLNPPLVHKYMSDDNSTTRLP
jgi:hypothetical protein